MQLLNSNVSQQASVGTAIRTWGEGVKDICLVHGFLAHSYWWHWMATAGPWQNRLIAPDLSGMGQSQWRDAYSLLAHAHELATHIDRSMWLIGHSYGGMVCYLMAVLYPEKVKGLVLIDSPLKAWMEKQEHASVKPSLRPRVYHSLEEMRQSFVLFPAQPFPSEDIKHELFEHSYRQDCEGYHWLFDPILMKHLRSFEGVSELRQYCEVPICYMAGEYSSLSSAVDRVGLMQWAPMCTFVTIPRAHHAVLLDQPVRLMEEILAWIGTLA